MPNKKKLFFSLTLLLIYFLSFHLLLGFNDNLELKYFSFIYRAIPVYLAIILLISTTLSIKWMRKLGLIILIGSFVIRLVCFNIFTFYGSHIDEVFWSHALFKTSVSTGLSWGSIISILPFSLIAIFSFFLIIKFNHKASFSKKNVPTFISFFLLIGLSIPLLRSYREKNSQKIPYDVRSYFQLLPERQFFSSLYRFLSYKKFKSPKELNKNTISSLKKIGIIFDPDKQYPLEKNSIYIHGKKTDDIERYPGKNIVFIFLESYSSFFLELESVSPNINSFLDDKNTYSFTHILNSINSTMQGQIATLGSYLDIYREQVYLRKNQISSLSYSFINKILKKRGYKNVHLNPSSGQFAHQKKIMLKNGYDEFHDTSSQLHKEYMEKTGTKLNAWGAYDSQTFAIGKQLIKRLHNSPEPYFLSMRTLEVHWPYLSEKKIPGNKKRILDSAFSTDAAFGDFFSWFKNSKYSKNTILVLTADHSAHPNSFYKEVRGSHFSDFHEKIPFAIWSQEMKGNKDPTIGTNLDIAPTLLDLLDIDSKNSFLGLSLFSERKEFPWLTGKINLNKKFNINNSDFWSSLNQKDLKEIMLWTSFKNKITTL